MAKVKTGENKQLAIAVGCVVHNERVLLIRRNEPDIPSIHGQWELPGGKIEFGEAPAKTAEREVFEETGVQVQSHEMLPFTYVAIRETDSNKINPIVLCFRCKKIGGNSLRHMPKKSFGYTVETSE
jgi:8-oxo-dGTP diphosphatase